MRSGKIRVAAYNILDGGADRADRILAAIRRLNPDVLCLIEADDGMLVRFLATELKMNFVDGRGEKHAVAILSRFPVSSSINYSGLLGKPRNMLLANIVPSAPSPAVRSSSLDPSSANGGASGVEIPMIAVHLKGGALLSDEAYRLGEIDLLLKQLERFRQNNIPHILAGDFNSNSPIQRIEVGKCTPRTRQAFEENGQKIPRDVISRLLDAGYCDTLAQALGEPAAGMKATFTTGFPGQRLDYILTWGLDCAQAGVGDFAIAASDHFPVYAEI